MHLQDKQHAVDHCSAKQQRGAAHPDDIFLVVQSPTDNSATSVSQSPSSSIAPSPGCSIPFMILLAAPRLAIMMAWSAQWSALGPLLEILLPSSAVQLVQLAGPICGLLVVPTVGVFSDNCTSRFGRRRPYLFAGAVASILSWLALMFATDIGDALGDTSPSHRPAATALTVLCYVWMDISLNMAMVPANLIMADFAGDRQVTASVVGGIVAAGGQLSVSAYITAFGPAHQSLKTFLGMLIATTAATTLATVWFAHETPKRPALASSSIDHPVRDAFLAVYNGIRSLPSQLAVYFVILGLTQYGYTAYNGAKGQFFGLVVKGGTSDGADLCGKHSASPCTPRQDAFNDGVRLAGLSDMMQGVALVFVLCLPSLVHRFGVRRVVIFGILPQTLLIVMAFSKVVELNVAIAAACSITQATIFLLAMPLVVHVVGDTDLGMFSGALNSAMCLGQTLNYLLSSVLVQTSMGYALPVVVGGVLTVAAGVVAVTKLRVTMHSM